MSVMGYLISRNVMTSRDRMDLNAVNRREDRVRLFLSLLDNKGRSAYDLFLKALRRIGYYKIIVSTICEQEKLLRKTLHPTKRGPSTKTNWGKQYTESVSTGYEAERSGSGSISSETECVLCKDDTACRTLPKCFHALCENCVIRGKRGNRIICPICRQESRISMFNIDYLSQELGDIYLDKEVIKTQQRKDGRHKEWNIGFEDIVPDFDSIVRKAECFVCNEKCANRVLPTCYHSLCESCIIQIKKRDLIRCPICQQANRIPMGNVHFLSRNLIAMRITEKATEIKQTKEGKDKDCHYEYEDSDSEIDSIAREAECVVCKDNTADTILPICDHNICEICVRKLKWGSAIKCPVCHQESIIPLGNVDSLPKNLISTEVKKRVRKIKLRQQKGQMRLIIQELSCRSMQVTVPGATSTVDYLYKVIKREVGIPGLGYRLLCRGKELIKGTKLSHYGIRENDVIHMVYRTLGG